MLPAASPQDAEHSAQDTGDVRAGPDWDRLAAWGTWLVVALGAGLRLRQWWSGRSFWLDELLLLRAMAEQPVGGVLRPLALDQSAPPGWLLAEHLLLDRVPGERGARLLPLLFGIGALVLAALLARTLLGPAAALVATAVVAVSTALVQYSAELKQYSADAFWLQLVLLLGVRLALRRGRFGRTAAGLAAAAAAAVWFSHVTAIAAAGVFLALGLLAAAGRRPRELVVLVGCAMPAAALLAVEYVTLLSRNAADPVLAAYWQDAFPPAGPLTVPGGWDWLSGRVVALVRDPLYWRPSWPLLALVLVGLAVLGRRRPRAMPVLLLPVAAVAAAGLLRVYPISARLALWLVPLVAIAVAAPLDLFRPPAGRSAGRWVAALVALAAAAQLVAVAAPSVGTDAGYLAAPREKEESRPAFQLVARERRPGDLVLVEARRTGYAAAYYGPKVGLGDFRLVRAGGPGAGCPRVRLGGPLRSLPSVRRIWLVHAHLDAPTVQLFAGHLVAFGPVAERRDWTGAGVLRFDRAAVAPRLPPPPRYCLRIEPAGAPPGPA